MDSAMTVFVAIGILRLHFLLRKSVGSVIELQLTVPI